MRGVGCEPAREGFHSARRLRSIAHSARTPGPTPRVATVRRSPAVRSDRRRFARQDSSGQLPGPRPAVKPTAGLLHAKDLLAGRGLPPCLQSLSKLLQRFPHLLDVLSKHRDDRSQQANRHMKTLVDISERRDVGSESRDDRSVQSGVVSLFQDVVSERRDDGSLLRNLRSKHRDDVSACQDTPPGAARRRVALRRRRLRAPTRRLALPSRRLGARIVRIEAPRRRVASRGRRLALPRRRLDSKSARRYPTTERLGIPGRRQLAPR